MRRRAFLGTVGIGLAALAGCTTRADPNGQSPTNTDTTTTPTDEPTTSEPTNTDQMTDHKLVTSGDTTETMLGDRTLSGDGARTPHGVVLDNPTGETWTGQLVIRGPDDSVALDETYELESEAKVAVTLTDPLRYTAEASVPATGASETVTMELTWFDCNASSTSFTIQPDGKLESGTISTKMACLNVETARVPTGEKKSLSLGDGSLPDGDRKPHGVTVANPTDDSWTARLVITREEEVLLDGIYTLESDATVAVTLTEADDYHGTVSIPTAGTSESLDIGSEQFDCNHSSTNAEINSDGELKVTTISTLMACQSTDPAQNETTDQ